MDITLQVNLSGGAVPYARLTVPRLAAAHRGRLCEAIGVVDCCRPQRTQMVDPDTRFPPGVFREAVSQVSALAEELKADRVFDRVVYVREGDPRIRELLRKYVGWPVRETHDCYGAGLIAYLVGFEEVRTRYLLHYDADMLLHQAVGYDWVGEGIRVLERDGHALAATPRVSPPGLTMATAQSDATSLHHSDAFVEAMNGYWRVGWFSTRCFIIDLDRFRSWLPLLTFASGKYLAEVLARKLLARGYPPSPEMLIHRKAQRRGSYRIDLMTRDAFVLHPNDKGERFLRLLPALLASVGRGDVPHAQRGWENVKLDAWEDHIAATSAETDSAARPLVSWR